MKKTSISFAEQKYKAQCKMCKKVFEIPVTQKQIDDWKSGTLIQRAMPNLTPDQRELLKTGTCGDCWNKLFKDGKLSKRLLVLADQIDSASGKSLWQRSVKEEILAVAYLGPVNVFIKTQIGILHSDQTQFVWKIVWEIYGVLAEKDHIEYSDTTYKTKEEALIAAKEYYETKYKTEMRIRT